MPRGPKCEKRFDDLREGKGGMIKLAAAHGVGVRTVQRIKASLNL